MNGIFDWWRWEYLWQDKYVFFEGFLVTVKIVFFALILALILGFTIGILSTLKNRILNKIARIYLEVFRNTPLALQILFIYYGMAYCNLPIQKSTVGIIGIGLCIGAYISEILRAGMESIPIGQYEAAYSQGMNYFQVLIKIILPQTVRIILPPLASQLVVLILSTSLTSMIAGGDLLYRTSNWSSNGTLSYGPAYLVCGILYFVICFPITFFARWYERKLETGKQ